MTTAAEVEAAKKLLTASGYVVLREKSYRQAQERQRVAEALKEYADECRAGTERWAQGAVTDARVAWKRCAFLYGAARAHGATEDELRGGA